MLLHSIQRNVKNGLGSVIGKGSHDVHGDLAFGADHRIKFVGLVEHLGPAVAGGPIALLFYDEAMLFYLYLTHPSFIGVAADSVIFHSDLAFV